MASPNHHPLPEYSSSDEEVNSYKELPEYDSDHSDFEWERDMQILWAEVDKAKAELDADLEKERLAEEAREAEREEEEAERLLAEMAEESEEGEDDWDN